jgi:hypothetical protein
MDDITRATVRIEPVAESARQTVPVEEMVAAIAEDQILGRDDGPPLTLDIATMLDATLCQLTATGIVIELADERRVDDDAFDAMLGDGDIDDFDPSKLESMEAHSGLETASHEPLPLAHIAELPALVISFLEVVGDWVITCRGALVELEDLLPPPAAGAPEEAPLTPPTRIGPYGEDDAAHWATTVVRALVQNEDLELATVRDQNAVQKRVAYILEDVLPSEPVPLAKIIEKLFEMPGVVELYADDDAVMALFEQNRPA